MAQNEKPQHRFSKLKTDLKPGEFDQTVDYSRIKDIVVGNRELVMNSGIAKRGEGIFRFPNFERFFSLDGSIISKDKPEELFYLDFFRKSGRIATKEITEKSGKKEIENNTYYLRGERYLASINPNLETRQRLEILLEDFVDGVYFLQEHSQIISNNESVYKQELAILDYIKNSAITILNALIQNEKLGIFRLEDKKYQNMRKSILTITHKVVQMYFAYLVGNDDDYRNNLDSVTKRFQEFENVILYLEQEYREGAINNMSFSRPEDNHPLVIGASALLNAEKLDSHPDVIFSFPSGGTELALTQQYAFKLTKHYEPQVVLIPFSLYSVSQMPKRKIADRKTITPLEFLVQHRKSIDNREVLIVEDNSNTGNTIQRFYDLLIANFKPRKVDISVAEADIVRAKQLKDSKVRTTVASSEVFESAVNILPVGKRKLQTEIKADIEKQRLIKECELNLRNAKDSTEKMMYSIFLRNLIEPTESILKKLTSENSIQKFSGTPLSNYYVTPIKYYGVDYTSTEKAYQAEKFKKEDLASMSKPEMKEEIEFIRERFRKMGVYLAKNDLSNFFTDQNTTSGMSKAMANILRGRGFQKPEWENIKFKIMLELLQIKFQNPDMMQKLKDTGDKYLVEGNDWGDIFWGVDNGVGKNMLGLALMYIRDGEKFLKVDVK
jgi:predicted NAD-dependent protein-ADP-ribosyltransferase YbiA (DUF1768 family)/hypoxanthine phosphoribosyltransferase